MLYFPDIYLLADKRAVSVFVLHHAHLAQDFTSNARHKFRHFRQPASSFAISAAGQFTDQTLRKEHVKLSFLPYPSRQFIKKV